MKFLGSTQNMKWVYFRRTKKVILSDGKFVSVSLSKISSMI